MDELTAKIDELAGLMEEFGLAEAEFAGPDWKVAFRRPQKTRPSSALELDAETFEMPDPAAAAIVTPPEPVTAGTPVNSPMNGIYYTSPSPTSSAFVKVGEAVVAGQVVGLIEAMKVFNEIVAPISGTVVKMVAESGQLVQPGDPLLYIG